MMQHLQQHDDVISISKSLISFNSVTPAGGKIFSYIIGLIEPLGFKCQLLEFGTGEEKVSNLYARYGAKGQNICFAGHVDVVPSGDESAWRYGAFNPTIESDVLYGRGAVDMKCAIAAFLDAAMQAVKLGDFKHSISLLITGDEEGPALFGTQEVLKVLENQGEKIDYCILGEPTCEDEFGDTILIGRRGSVSYVLEVQGIQGHVAYPNNTVNPVNTIVQILADIKAVQLDSGNEFFQASNLEITTIDVDNKVTNLIPQKATAVFNVRYNEMQTSEGMAELFSRICTKYTNSFTLTAQVFAKPFIAKPGSLVEALQLSIATVLPNRSQGAALSTAGGTSDARFIQHYISEVAEFGLLTTTAHHVDENARVQDVIALRDIYLQTILHLGGNYEE
jgi:succinyl-diaminopimelate desuccinylase